MTARAAALVLFGLPLLFMGACGDAAEPGDGHGVLLVAIDGLRADHVGAWGYDRPTTPHLDGLAAEGVRFAEAWSTAPRTQPAHVSLFTGCHPLVGRLHLPLDLELPEELRWALPEGAPRLAVEFLSRGFATGAFLDTDQFPPLGAYDQGFQVFDWDDPSDPRPPAERGLRARSADLRDWLATLPEGRPWFAYLHVRDLERTWFRRDPEWDEYFVPRDELPYVPPVGGDDDTFFAIPRSRWQRGAASLGQYEARYDGALRRVDQELGALFRSLEVAGHWERTSVAVVGTHGVQFGEAGLFLASGMLAPADLHVPFVVRPAADLPGAARGAVAAELASLVDVGPTLLDLAGLDVPTGMHGRSQLGALRGEAESVHAHVFASCGRVAGALTVGADGWMHERSEFGREGEAAVVRWFGEPEPAAGTVREVVWNRRDEPYPISGRPRRASPAERAAELATASEVWRGNVYATWAVLQGATFSKLTRDPGLVDHLRETGYLGSAR